MCWSPRRQRVLLEPCSICYVQSLQIYLALRVQASTSCVCTGIRDVRSGRDRQPVTHHPMILAASFLPLVVAPSGERLGTAAVTALLLSAGPLAIGSATLLPFEMRTVVLLSGDRLVPTQYGFYSAIVGVGIIIGNLAIGAFVSVAHGATADEIIWGEMILISTIAVVGLLPARQLYLRSPAAAPEVVRSQSAALSSDRMITIESISENE